MKEITKSTKINSKFNPKSTLDNTEGAIEKKDNPKKLAT
jgi:hypothetical protein